MSHFEKVKSMTREQVIELKERIERELPRPDYVRDNHVLNGWIEEWAKCASDRDSLLKTVEQLYEALARR